MVSALQARGSVAVLVDIAKLLASVNDLPRGSNRIRCIQLRENRAENQFPITYG
jgi:hypothetical protein